MNENANGASTKPPLDSISAFLNHYKIETKEPTGFASIEDRIIPNGARNETITALAGVFQKIGLAPNIARAALYGIGTNPRSIAESMTVEEIDHIADEIAGRSSQPFDTYAYTVTTVTPGDRVKTLDWLIPGVIPNEGLTLLYGLPAQGKSWIALLAALVAMGAMPWVDGWRAKRKRKVGYFDWERRGEMFKRRLKKLARGVSAEIDYVECRRPMGDMIDDIKELALVRGYEFIIVDSLSIAIMTADLMAANEIIPKMFALHELHIPILLLDHQKKLQNGDSAQGGTAYGSMFKEAIVSCAWQAVKLDVRAYTEGYMDFQLVGKKNNFDVALEDIKLRLEIDDANDTVRIVPLQETPRVSVVLDALARRDEMTIDELVSVTGASASTIRRDLDDPTNGLVAQGAVIVTSEGGDGRGNARTYALARWNSSERPDGSLPPVPSTYRSGD